MKQEEVFNAGNADIGTIRTVETGAYGAAEEEMAFGSTKEGEMNEPVYRKPGDKKKEELVPDEEGIIPFIDQDMLIGDIIDAYPDASLVFMRCGMYCITCPASQMETLEQACAVHGLEAEDVAKVLNDYLTEQARVAEEEAADASADVPND